MHFRIDGWSITKCDASAVRDVLASLRDRCPRHNLIELIYQSWTSYYATADNTADGTALTVSSVAPCVRLAEVIATFMDKLTQTVDEVSTVSGEGGSDAGLVGCRVVGCWVGRMLGGSDAGWVGWVGGSDAGWVGLVGGSDWWVGRMLGGSDWWVGRMHVMHVTSP